jgi:hypothetical protein
MICQISALPRKVSISTTIWHSDLELIVRVNKYLGGSVSWGDAVADMLRVIAEVIDPGDTAATGRFNRANRGTLDHMRRADGGATVEHRLGDRDRDREFRECCGCTRPR